MRFLLLFFCLLSYTAKGQLDALTIKLEVNTSADKHGSSKTTVQLSLFSIVDSSYEVKVEQYKIARDKDFRLQQSKAWDTTFLISSLKFNSIIKEVVRLNSAQIMENIEANVYVHPTTITLSYGNSYDFVSFSFVYTKDRENLDDLFRVCREILKVAGIRRLLQ